MYTEAETLTAPVPTVEPVRFPFTTLIPQEIDGDPEACIRYWKMSARLQGLEPVGTPEVMHVERRRITLAYKPVWVQDDGSPVEFVAGHVVNPFSG